MSSVPSGTPIGWSNMLSENDTASNARTGTPTAVANLARASAAWRSLSQRHRGLAEADALAGDIERRRIAGRKSAFEEGDDLHLGRLAAFHQRSPALRRPKVEERRPDSIADLPRCCCDVLARRFDEIARHLDSLLAFTGRLQYEIHDDPDRPGRGVDQRRVLSGLKAERRIGGLPGRFDAGLGERQLGTRHFHLGMEVEGRQRQGRQIPRGPGIRGTIWQHVGDEPRKRRIRESPLLKSGGGHCRLDRLCRVGGTSGDNHSSGPKGQSTSDTAYKSLGDQERILPHSADV